LLQARDREGRQFVLEGRVLRDAGQSQALRRRRIEEQCAAVDRAARVAHAQFVDDPLGKDM
jgi:hypothetical protein